MRTKSIDENHASTNVRERKVVSNSDTKELRQLIKV